MPHDWKRWAKHYRKKAHGFRELLWRRGARAEAAYLARDTARAELAEALEALRPFAGRSGECAGFDELDRVPTFVKDLRNAAAVLAKHEADK